MPLLERYLKKQIELDLKKKMVFLAGPRQIGKTHFSKTLKGGQAGYMNWDTDIGKDKILEKLFLKVTFGYSMKYTNIKNGVII